jgi:hypothetical protein
MTCGSTSSTTCGCVFDGGFCGFTSPQGTCGGACPHVTDACFYASPFLGCVCATFCGTLSNFACAGGPACPPGRNCVPGIGPACICN